MARISEHIERHARRIKERTVDKLHRSSVRIIATVLLVVLLILSLSIYEGRVVRNQNITNPIECTTLLFHQAQCEQMLLQLYSNTAPLLRAPICEHPEKYGLSGLCPAYYDAKTAQLYDRGLHDRGVSVWEPTVNVTKEFHIKSLGAIHDVHIVCDGLVVDAVINATNATMLSASINNSGSCEIVAASSEGTLTSFPFNVS